MIADTQGNRDEHAIHQTFDICEEGNIDRVARLLGLAFSIVEETLAPLIDERHFRTRIPDLSYKPGNYTLNFRKGVNLKRQGDKRSGRRRIPSQTLRNTIHEFLVCRVIAGWLSITMPDLSLIWREKANLCIEALKEMCSRLSEQEEGRIIRRRLFPF